MLLAIKQCRFASPGSSVSASADARATLSSNVIRKIVPMKVLVFGHGAKAARVLFKLVLVHVESAC